MQLLDYQNKIIELFIRQELLIASLYDKFSSSFLAQKEFWEGMAGEEREHAGWIKHFQDSVAKDKIYFSEGKVRTYTLQSSLDYINGILIEFSTKHFNSAKAVSVALDIERALLEKNVFKCFNGDSDEAKRILEVLITEQERHCQKIEQYAARLRCKT